MSPGNEYNSERLVPERTETAFMPVDWSVDPEKIRQMTPEQRAAFDIEMAEKASRLHEAQQELAIILTASGITYEGETPRVIINRTLDPDQYRNQSESQTS